MSERPPPPRRRRAAPVEPAPKRRRPAQPRKTAAVAPSIESEPVGSAPVRTRPRTMNPFAGKGRMLRNVLRLALVISLAVLMSPAYMPALLHVVAFVTERPVAVDYRANGYSVQEGEEPMEAIRTSGGRRVTLQADARGHYQAEATINGKTVPVLIDTGATSVALRAEDVFRLGLRPPMPSDFTVPISTANGTTRAARVTLDEIRIGGVRVRKVEALVMPEKMLATNLLGMSFIRRLSNVEMTGGKLTFVE